MMDEPKSWALVGLNIEQAHGIARVDRDQVLSGKTDRVDIRYRIFD